MIEAFENAPLDDEPITEEQELAVDEAREAYRRGETGRFSSGAPRASFTSRSASAFSSRGTQLMRKLLN